MGRVIEEMVRQTPYYELSFDIKPFGYKGIVSSIMRITTGSDKEVTGDRNPAIFFKTDSTQLYICSAINTNKNFCFNSVHLPLFEWSNVKISQDIYDEKLRFKVFVNGDQKYSIDQNYGRFYENQTIYNGDPWYEPSNALMSNVVFKNMPNDASKC